MRKQKVFQVFTPDGEEADKKREGNGKKNKPWKVGKSSLTFQIRSF